MWWLLIVSATPSVAARLDHVGVERSLDEPLHVAELPRLVLEDADELLADPLALLLGVDDPGELREEALLRLDVDERTPKWPPNVSTTCSASSLPQQAVVDEDAGELVADRLVHEQRGDGAVDAAGEPAEDAVAPDARADPLDLLLDHRGRRPRG